MKIEIDDSILIDTIVENVLFKISHLNFIPLVTNLYKIHGDEGNRTPDLPDANGMLSQTELRPHSQN